MQHKSMKGPEMQSPFQPVTETIRQLEQHHLAAFGMVLAPKLKADLSDETLVHFLTDALEHGYPLTRQNAFGPGMSGTLRDGRPFKISGFPRWMNMPGP